MGPITVVVPLPRDAQALEKCAGSIGAPTGSGLRRLVVVVDASTEPDTATLAQSLAAAGRAEVIELAGRADLAAAVNQALPREPERDVLVLSEHVVLHGDALDRLVAHLERDPRAGIVMPLLGSGGVDGNAVSTACGQLDVATADELFRVANAGVAVELPFACGPCILITRACLSTVGRLDPSTFPSDAGALIDFSIRAAKAGFVLLLAGDVCVANDGVPSATKKLPDDPSCAILARRYPDFHDRMRTFVWRHPGRAMQCRADFAHRAGSPKPLLVFIAHRWGGGIRRHMKDLALLAAPVADTLFLEPTHGGVVRLGSHPEEAPFELFFRLPDEVEDLVDILSALPVARLHFHHVHDLPQVILDLPARIGLPYDCTLHDYYPICPQYQLVTKDGAYCGEPDAMGCAVCIAGRPAQWGLDIAQWRSALGRLLRGAARVIAPSHDVARRMGRYFPDLVVAVWPNPEPVAVRAPRVVRVATIGTLSLAKGSRVVEACAADAKERGLPLAFRVLGATVEPMAQAPRTPVTVYGEYADADLPGILAAERPDVLLFAAQWPETYLYTLSAAMATALPIVASDLGALAERLAGHRNVAFVPVDATAAEWNRALLAAGGHAEGDAEEPPAIAVGTEPARYAEAYLEPLTAARSRAALVDALPLAAAHVFAPEDVLDAPELPLAALFAAGVECGHREARVELKRRVGLVERQVEELQRTSDAAAECLEQCEASLAAAQARVDAIESSTTWRMTAPLRSTIHGAKIAAARWRAGFAEVGQLPRRAQLAASVLKDEGPRALGARVLRKLRAGHRFRPSAAPRYRQATAIRALAFAASTAPRVSIVIPVYGKPLLTFTCLASVHAHTPPGTYEVIVVDDASPEPVAESLRLVEGVRFERNPDNLGFLGTCNRGASLARGQVLVLLNNDTIVTPGWLEAIEQVFRDHPDAGLVGAKLLYPDGRLQEAGGIVWRDGSAWNYGRDDDPDKPQYNYLREADYCSGACVAVPLALFRELGGFDSRYAPAYYEDTDLAFAVRAVGRRVYYQPAATILHFEGQTSGTDETSGVKRHQVLNQSVFRKKWAQVLDSHRANGMAVELERDRWAQRRVLVIEACMLRPDEDSGSVRMLAILELLVELRCKVTFVADNLEHRQPYVNDLQQRGIEVLFSPYVRSVSDVIAARGSEFDLVVVARHYIAVKHIQALRTFAPRALVAFDTVDLHFLRAERLAELEGGAMGKASARARRDEELALMRKADVTLVVSPVEKGILASLAPEARVMLLTNIHEPQPGGKPFAERAGLVFIGGFQHPPNTDAVLWYAQQILPRLREKLPGVITYIVGSKVPSTIQSLAASDFVVTGYVPDVTPFFTGCRVSIAPLRYGAGVKGKVNLAMSYGLPVVGTTAAVEGMQLTPGEDVLVADDAEAFAAAICRVYHDEALWQKLAAGGVANVRNVFSREVARETLKRLLAAVDARKKPGSTAATRWA